MSDKNDYFSRVSGRVDLGALGGRFVLVVGVGSVGSVVALELARCGVGHLALADGDHLELHNPARHALPIAYVGTNKAEAMAAHLRHNVPGLDVGALARHLNASLTDLEIDRLLAPCDLVVLATDERAVQRRIARRALALDIPAVIPGLYPDHGGEIFVQLGPGQACFFCWDGFREDDSEVRGATSVNADALPVVQQAVYLALGVLDPRSPQARELAPPAGDPRPRQLFVLRPAAALLRVPVRRRPGCPSCAVGPSSLNERAGATRHTTAAAHLARTGLGRDAAAGWAFAADATPAAPTIASVDVSEPLVLAGSTVTLTWDAKHATHVEVETLGRRPPAGQAEVLVERTRTFRVRAVNPFGTTELASPVVRTIPLPRIEPLSPPAFPSMLDAPPPAPPWLPAPPWQPAPWPLHDPGVDVLGLHLQTKGSW